MDAHTWQRIDRLCQWLDEETPSASGSDVRLLRVLKISEEMGRSPRRFTARWARTHARAPPTPGRTWRRNSSTLP